MAIIKKIQLSDGQVYSFFDTGAIRQNSDGILITGNEVIDNVILGGKLSIISIDDIPITKEITNVLVQEDDKSIAKRSTDLLLKDIGGVSCRMNEETGILQFQIGKF